MSTPLVCMRPRNSTPPPPNHVLRDACGRRPASARFLALSGGGAPAAGRLNHDTACTLTLTSPSLSSAQSHFIHLPRLTAVAQHPECRRVVGCFCDVYVYNTLSQDPTKYIVVNIVQYSITYCTIIYFFSLH